MSDCPPVAAVRDRVVRRPVAQEGTRAARARYALARDAWLRAVLARALAAPVFNRDAIQAAVAAEGPRAGEGRPRPPPIEQLVQDTLLVTRRACAD